METARACLIDRESAATIAPACRIAQAFLIGRALVVATGPACRSDQGLEEAIGPASLTDLALVAVAIDRPCPIVLALAVVIAPVFLIAPERAETGQVFPIDRGVAVATGRAFRTAQELAAVAVQVFLIVPVAAVADQVFPIDLESAMAIGPACPIVLEVEGGIDRPFPIDRVSATATARLFPTALAQAAIDRTFLIDP